MPNCLYCRAPIEGVDVLDCGVKALEDHLDILVLYVHRRCQKERTCVDPDACWKMLCESLHELHQDLDDKNARARAIDLLDILARWLRMGGFPPAL
jgi:hypothetical protein